MGVSPDVGREGAQDRGDKVVRDLATRLLSRDLFKQVPISPDEVKDLNKHGSTRVGELEEVLRKSLNCKDAEFYFHIDSHKLNLLEQGSADGRANDRCARFIHTGEDGRPAELVRDTELVTYGKKTEEERLFVPEIALRPVKEFFDAG